jgi:hypothetical protein
MARHGRTERALGIELGDRAPVHAESRDLAGTSARAWRRGRPSGHTRPGAAAAGPTRTI